MVALITALIFAISEQTINNLFRDIVVSIEADTKDYLIPDQFIQIDMERSLSMMLRDIHIEKLTIEGYEATMISPDSIDLDIKTLNLKLSFKYEYAINHLGDQGSARLEILNSTLSTTAVSSDPSTIKFSPVNTKVKIGELFIEVLRPKSVNQNWFFSMFKSDIKDLVSNMLKNSLNMAIESINLKDTYIPISNSGICFNYSLSHPLKVTNTMLEADFLGIFVQDSNPNYNPPIPKPKNFMTTNDQGIQILASDYIINSLSYSAYKLELLNFTITSSQLPIDFPFDLTTTIFGMIIPELITEYGLGKPLAFSCIFAQPPELIFADNPEWSVTVQASGFMECQVLVESDIALLLGISLISDSTLYLENWKLKGTINDIEIKNIECIAGTIKAETRALKEFINTFMKFYIDTLNKSFLDEGIEIPSYGRFNLTDSKMKSGSGYVYLLINPSISFTLEDLINYLD
ncbi:hypothetical protein SteCoe_18305 [Stentor coeruleus]|uniref:Lipid-binding serum glycoprotein C-terminal domain-containing protein n=1 Tax=Stentor coeruleus TaxID=5963 RepID=A0A1R2BWU6_9CILI|nr:hypothetical protein SteCoe_18305 [Stentor coeruleus]